MAGERQRGTFCAKSENQVDRARRYIPSECAGVSYRTQLFSLTLCVSVHLRGKSQGRLGPCFHLQTRLGTLRALCLREEIHPSSDAFTCRQVLSIGAFSLPMKPLFRSFQAFPEACTRPDEGLVLAGFTSPSSTLNTSSDIFKTIARGRENCSGLSLVLSDFTYALKSREGEADLFSLLLFMTKLPPVRD